MDNIRDFPQKYFHDLKTSIDSLDSDKINKVISVLFEAYRNDKKIFIFGNGGSASTASHFACDLSKGTLANVYDEQEKRFRVISLTDNVATITAFGNDLAFEDVFVQQLKNLVEKGDMVVVMSASGNSPNIVKAIEYAKKCGAVTIGFLGFRTGGKIGQMVDYEITIQDDHYGRIEDIHLILGHLITNSLDNLKKGQRAEEA